MADSKKYYYMKLKENFFESDEMVILESMQNGYVYSNILLKMYLKSIKNDGKLMFNDKIPFNTGMLATVTRHSVGDIERAVKIFQDLGLIEIMDSGAIYMSDIQNYIGRSSTEADRKREYRLKINSEKENGTNVLEMSSKRPPEIEIEKEIEIEIEIDTERELEKERKKKHKHGEYSHVLLTQDQLDQLFSEYGEASALEYISFLDEYIEMKGYKAKNHYLAIKKWVVDAVKERKQKKGHSEQEWRDSWANA